jgi:23S rRNA pseudouridine955/2504/2580 synthase
MHVSLKEGAPARTRYRVIERAGNTTAWVQLEPYTGRTHQLRVHMAAIGHPIVGDGKYGHQEAFLTGGISRKMHLHARRLRVDHPDGSKLDVTADAPRHFVESLAHLGFDLELGDALPFDPPKFSETAEGKKKAISAAAKARRKDRKGERRSRGSR